VSERTTLYRLRDSQGKLLYVGISGNPGRRFHQHSKDKPWWPQVASSTMEHFDTRREAEAAEMDAIKTERPAFNVVHNDGKQATATTLQERFRFTFTHRNGHVIEDDLSLLAEYPCIGYLDDVWYEDGNTQLNYWVMFVREHYQDAYDDDAIPIYWNVMGGQDGDFWYEPPPFPKGAASQKVVWPGEHFLDVYSVPRDANGIPINWFSLPIFINGVTSQFSKALGWRPSPLEKTIPLRSIMAMRHGSRRNQWIKDAA
jgi:predicted GIY-YIG superfamily endonuclease